MKRKRRKPSPEGRFSYGGLDRIIHERARLGILTSLMTNTRGLVFNDLKELCLLTDGNLSRHLQILSDAGLVELLRGAGAGRPQTLCRLTPEGRKRFLEYLAELENVVADAVKAAKEKSAGSSLPEGWVPA